MSYERKNGQGALFKNDRKAAGSPQPDYTGDFLLNGTTYRIAAWLKDGKKGKFMSLAVSEKGDEPQSRKPAKDESIPF